MPLDPLPEPETLPERLGALAKALPISTVLMSALLALNGAQTASLALLPVSRQRFRAFNRWAADTWWGWCVDVSRLLNNVRIVITGDDVPARENAVVVVNHQEMPDITVLMAFAKQKERLGDLKFFVKDPLKYVPGIGWGMLFLDCLFVKRDWTADASTIERVFARILRDRVPLWLVSFVEGTRLSPRKLAASREYARTHGLPEPRHLQLPRTKGFVASVEALREHLDAVYDVTIGYERGVPTLWQYVKGLAPKVHMHVRRHPVADLPHGSEALAAWLFARFADKDELLEAFYRDGHFPD